MLLFRIIEASKFLDRQFKSYRFIIFCLIENSDEKQIESRLSFLNNFSRFRVLFL